MSEKKLRWTIYGILIASLLLGVAFVAWQILYRPAPVLGPVLPDYPAAIFHKTDNITYDSDGRHHYEITFDCGPGIFGVEDYRAYSTDDRPQDILFFYQDELAKIKFDENGYRASYLLLGRYDDVVNVPLITKLACLHKGSSVIKYPGYALLYLDPKVPAEAAVIKKYLPDLQTTKLVFFVMRGFISRG